MYENGFYLYEHTWWYLGKKEKQNWRRGSKQKKFVSRYALICIKFAPYGNAGYSWVENVLSIEDSDTTGAPVLPIRISNSSISTRISLVSGWRVSNPACNRGIAGMMLLEAGSEKHQQCPGEAAACSLLSTPRGVAGSSGTAPHITQLSTGSFSKTQQYLNSPNAASF